MLCTSQVSCLVYYKWGGVNELHILTLRTTAFFSLLLTNSPPLYPFYRTLYAEITAINELLLTVKGLHVDHKKKAPKFALTFLLDKAELNSKSRCVFAWADPSFKGFAAPKDDATRSLESILRSRKEFYPEGLEVLEAAIRHFLVYI
jgi:hypothetical protein